MEAKTKKTGRFYPVFVVVVFSLFMLLHQTDKLMIGSLQIPVSESFNLTNTQWGLINSGALIIGTILYPIWGVLYDRYSRPKLLALASLIWGLTTWMSSIVRSFGAFLVTRSSTGIDDSSYPGLYSLIADYFDPKQRGKIYGLIQLTQPLGYLLGMILALMVAPALEGFIPGMEGWRTIFIFTGVLGVLMSLVIFFGIKEMPRGQAEPELEGIEGVGKIRFNWSALKDAMKKKTMWFVFLQGFAGVFPWNVITYFFFGYLMTERGYDESATLTTMGPIVLILAAGYFVGGFLGDWMFKRTLKGRILVSSGGVILGAIFLLLAMNTPVENRTMFFIFMCLTALFMPFSSPNVISTVIDISLPEVRASAQAVEYFVENSGAALAPIIAGIIADATSQAFAITSVSVSAWVLCFFLYLGALLYVEKDIKSLKSQLVDRANAEKQAKAAA